MRCDAFCLELVRQHAHGNIRIAPAYDHEVTLQAAVIIDLAGSFDGGMEAIVRPGDGEGRGGGEQLGVGGGKKELVLVQIIEHFAGWQLSNFNSPVSAGKL